SEVGSGLSARRVREGDEVCLIGVGRMLEFAEQAAEKLAAEGHSVTVWDPRVVKPLDPEMLADAARHALVVTVEDGVREGGAGSAIREALSALRPSGLPVVVLGTPDRYLLHGQPDQILVELGLDADGIASSTLAALASAV
ncbi:MAG: transketolase C-terminal domain-containing protein, partial [Acidimicrobiia bacterium]